MATPSELARGFIEEVLNAGNIEAAGTYFHDDMVEQVPLPGQGPGLAGLKDMLRGFHAAFPDIRWTILEQVEQGKKVMTRFEWTATHRGEFLGVPATGKPVTVWGMVIDRVEGDKIQDTRILMDTHGLMMQLGVIPRP
jgi:steroid delta-isomerase-like uncharacterized protein